MTAHKPEFRFESLITAPDHVHGRAGLWFVVGRNTVLVETHEAGLRFPELVHPRDVGLEVDHEHFLGLLGDIPVWAAGIDDPRGEPEGLRPESLFALFPHMPQELWVLAGRAVQIAEWHRTHRYCGRCGTPTQEAPGERARRCPDCGMLCFPKLAPAVITLVEREDGRALLARGKTFGPNPMYSALAGFVEPGENLEQCVAREIKEEVGVDVQDVRYFKSQPWPFPHSLMIGFQAKYGGGEIVCDPTEIVDAQWFSRDDLPNLPGGLSIARWLIDDWIARG